MASTLRLRLFTTCQHIVPRPAAADNAHRARPIRVGAHRGAMCDAPENTIEAFRLALEAGTYRIECDVRSNADGELFMMHDASVDRTTDGSGELRALTSTQVSCTSSYT